MTEFEAAAGPTEGPALLDICPSTDGRAAPTPPGAWRFHLRLSLELRRWRRARRRAHLWWRDDDARAPTPELTRLLAASARAGAPLSLAVIPGEAAQSLRPLLAGRDGISVIQHGVDHFDRRGRSGSGEFPREWGAKRLEKQLRLGWSGLEGLPGRLPVFAPPWNDIHPQLTRALETCGYRALSADGTPGEDDDFPRFDCEVDLLRWRGGARFRGAGRIGDALAGALARRRRSGEWDRPVGLLTHHLDHDEAAWDYLDSFLAWTAGRRELIWRGLPELVAPTLALAA